MKKSKKSIVKQEDHGAPLPIKQEATLDLVKELKSMKNVEDLGTAVLQSSHQFYLLIQSILKEKYGFNDTHLKDLNQEVAHAVEGLAYLEEKGLHPLSGNSIDQMVDVTINHYDVLKAARAGIELPTSKDAMKVLYGKKK
jgi:hypothetical protein